MQTPQTSVMLTLPFSFPGSLQWHLQVCCPVYCDLFKANVGWFPVPSECSEEHRTSVGPKMAIFSLEVEIDTVMAIIRELLVVNCLKKTSV